MTAEPAGRPDLRVVEDPEIVLLRQRVMEETIRRQDVEKELSKKLRRITFLENELAGKHTSRREKDPKYEDALKLCRYWKRKVAPKARKYDSPERIQPVLDRLNDTDPDTGKPVFTPRYIGEAIVGAAADPWVINGDVLKDISIICGKARNLQNFHDRYERWVARGRPPMGLLKA